MENNDKEIKKETGRKHPMDMAAITVFWLVLIVLLVDMIAGRDCPELTFMIPASLAVEGFCEYRNGRGKMYLAGSILLLIAAVIFAIDWIMQL